MSKKNDNIATLLGMTPREKTQNLVVPQQIDENQTEDEDIATARENTMEIYNTAMDAVNEMLAISKSSEDSKDFTALANLLKTALQANKDFEDQARANKKQKYEQFGNKGESEGESGNVTNNLFVGSTQELEAMFERIQAKKMKTIEQE